MPLIYQIIPWLLLVVILGGIGLAIYRDYKNSYRCDGCGRRCINQLEALGHHKTVCRQFFPEDTDKN